MEKIKNLNEGNKLNEEEKEEDDDEYIEEEMLVYVEIEPTSLSESQVKEASFFNIVGNEKNVLIQIDNRFFSGEHDYSIGTHVFFEKEDNSPTDPLYSRCDSLYKFQLKTNKTMKMNRVLLKDVTTANECATQRELDLEENELKITRTYEQALNLFLPPKKSAPRNVSEEDTKISIELINESNKQPVHSQNSFNDINEVDMLEEAMEQHTIKFDA